jgi:hypothetical protein
VIGGMSELRWLVGWFDGGFLFVGITCSSFDFWAKKAFPSSGGSLFMMVC